MSKRARTDSIAAQFVDVEAEEGTDEEQDLEDEEGM